MKPDMTLDTSNNKPRQLSLSVQLDDEATFDNYHTGVQNINGQVMSALKTQLLESGEQFIFLWGREGSGVSHLLQAACHEADVSGASSQYLPLAELKKLDAEALLEGLETLDLVCLDDLDKVVGSADWERALFRFFNAMRDGGKRVLMGAKTGPKELPVELPDLQSRLNWGLTYQLQPMSDEAKQQALQIRAAKRGLELSTEVAQFILHRSPRNTTELFASLQNLDRASLEEQRRLTIPFVKQVLGV